MSQYALLLIEKGIAEDFLTQKMNQLEEKLDQFQALKILNILDRLGPVIVETLFMKRESMGIFDEGSYNEFKELSQEAYSVIKKGKLNGCDHKK